MTEAEWKKGEKFDGTDPILKWFQIEQKKCFCVQSIELKLNTGLKFETYIIHYTDSNNDVYKCYAPSHFIKQIRKNRQQNMRPYFVSHGTVERGNNTIAQFEISYKQLKKEWSLFDDGASKSEV